MALQAGHHLVANLIFQKAVALRAAQSAATLQQQQQGSGCPSGLAGCQGGVLGARGGLPLPTHSSHTYVTLGDWLESVTPAWLQRVLGRSKHGQQHAGPPAAMRRNGAKPATGQQWQQQQSGGHVKPQVKAHSSSSSRGRAARLSLDPSHSPAAGWCAVAAAGAVAAAAAALWLSSSRPGQASSSTTTTATTAGAAGSRWPTTA
ncbi:hypothetical protein V8C86DRAFT_2775394 [Haematococcus lacustris]